MNIFTTHFLLLLIIIGIYLIILKIKKKDIKKNIKKIILGNLFIKNILIGILFNIIIHITVTSKFFFYTKDRIYLDIFDKIFKILFGIFIKNLFNISFDIKSSPLITNLIGVIIGRFIGIYLYQTYIKN